MKPVRTTTRNYDAAGAGSGRVIRIIMLWKLLRLKRPGHTPELWVLMSWWLRHRVGRLFAVVSVKHERRWLGFLRSFRQRRAVLVRRAGLYRDKLLGRL